MTRTSAVVLASGGLDSAVCLALARRDGGSVLALGIDYGQRNRIELDRLARIASHLDMETMIVSLDMRAWSPPGLVDVVAREVPGLAGTNYVPGRNLAFLGIAASVAEARGADRIYLGATAADLHHPDCTPAFLHAFREALATGMNAPPALRTPLVALNKSEIVLVALEMRVPIELTWSCHGPGPVPCGDCSPCRLRRDTFADLQLDDPALRKDAAPRMRDVRA
jgi:7-cyano-7-deazaguanine synthase